MEAVVAGSLRSERLTSHLLSTGASADCVGTSDCLTDCEVAALSKLDAVSTQWILNSESWICRTVRAYP